MSDTLELLHQLDKRIDRTIETMGNLERENIELKATISKMEITTSDLKSQIEKMKCCGNCKHFLENGYEYNDCDQYRWWDKCDKWELEE